MANHTIDWPSLQNFGRVVFFLGKFQWILLVWALVTNPRIRFRKGSTRLYLMPSKKKIYSKAKSIRFSYFQKNKKKTTELFRIFLTKWWSHACVSFTLNISIMHYTQPLTSWHSKKKKKKEWVYVFSFIHVICIHFILLFWFFILDFFFLPSFFRNFNHYYYLDD